IYFYGLCESRITVTDYHGNCDDICFTFDLPFLIEKEKNRKAVLKNAAFFYLISANTVIFAPSMTDD
ncbi:MAG: hypothetical protein ACLUOT_18770, partial [Bacteroides ovatus]